jgi:hypothetical protein
MTLDALDEIRAALETAAIKHSWNAATDHHSRWDAPSARVDFAASFPSLTNNAQRIHLRLRGRIYFDYAARTSIVYAVINEFSRRVSWPLKAQRA